MPTCVAGETLLLKKATIKTWRVGYLKLVFFQGPGRGCVCDGQTEMNLKEIRVFEFLCSKGQPFFLGKLKSVTCKNRL